MHPAAPVYRARHQTPPSAARHVTQKAAGKAEEFVGKRTDDEELSQQGQYDQSKGDARLNVEQAKDNAADVDKH